MTSATVTVRVRYAETDRMGYLHHSQYLVYFELARLELLGRLGISYRDMEDEGYLLVVVEASCRFLKPAGYDDELSIGVNLDRVTRTRLWHSYHITRTDDHTAIAEGRTLVGCVGPTGRPRALPRAVLEKLS